MVDQDIFNKHKYNLSPQRPGRRMSGVWSLDSFLSPSPGRGADMSPLPRARHSQLHRVLEQKMSKRRSVAPAMAWREYIISVQPSFPQSDLSSVRVLKTPAGSHNSHHECKGSFW